MQKGNDKHPANSEDSKFSLKTLVNSLTLQEAKASSEIENIITTNDVLFRAFTSETGNIDPQRKNRNGSPGYSTCSRLSRTPLSLPEKE